MPKVTGQPTNSVFPPKPSREGWVPYTKDIPSLEKGSVSVKGHRKGLIFIHQGIDEEGGPTHGKWVVSIIHLGLWVVCFNSEEDAYRAGEMLLARCQPVLQWPTQKEIVQKAPQWLLDWVRKTKETHKYEEPVR